MVPVFDMANHYRNCEHSISKYESSDFLHVVAGKDLQPGDEICNRSAACWSGLRSRQGALQQCMPRVTPLVACRAQAGHAGLCCRAGGGGGAVRMKLARACVVVARSHPHAGHSGATRDADPRVIVCQAVPACPALAWSSPNAPFTPAPF